MHIDIGDAACEVCGRHATEYRHSSLRRTYTCPGCAREVCCSCFFEHKCGFRLCSLCLGQSHLRRTEVKKVLGRSGILGQHHHTYPVTCYEHSWTTPPCKCGRKDKWYGVFDILNLQTSWQGLDGLNTY